MNPRPPEPQSDALPTELHSPPAINSIFDQFSLRSSIPRRREPPVSEFGSVARQKGFEPLTHGLEGRCSFHLSYWRVVGASRFERPTPCSQGRCATMLRYAPSPYRLTYGGPPLNSASDYVSIRWAKIPNGTRRNPLRLRWPPNRRTS